jgi:hypothetical protein
MSVEAFAGCGSGAPEDVVGQGRIPVGSMSPRNADGDIPALGRWSEARASQLALSAVGRHKNRLVVKFVNGTGVRSRDGRLFVVHNAPYARAAQQELAELEALLATAQVHVAMPALFLPEEHWVRDPTGARDELTNFFYIYLPPLPDERLIELLGKLNALTMVEIAYLSMPAAPLESADRGGTEELPWPSLPGVRLRERGGRLAHAGTTEGSVFRIRPPGGSSRSLRHLTDVPNFRDQQEYLGAAPVGVDSDYVLGRHWNSGSYVSYVAMDGNWYTDHVDLYGESLIDWVCGKVDPNLAVTAGFEASMHGTMTLGVIGAADEPAHCGTEGLAPQSMARLVPHASPGPMCAMVEGWSGADAIVVGLETGAPGEIMLIEWGHKLDLNANGVLEANETVPAEYDPLVEAAIRRATRPWVDLPGSGHRVVIEPAGNGNTHLGDTALFQDRFVSMGKDTFAVMVGNGTILEPLEQAGSNYGIRVDVNAGASFLSEKRSGAVSLGAFRVGSDDLVHDPTPQPSKNIDDYNHDYTQSCTGTSCAGAIVAGSALVLASVTKDLYGSFLQPTEMREFLKRAGSPQLLGLSTPIGRRPNLRRQVHYVHNRHARPHSTDMDADGRADITTCPKPGSGPRWGR